VVLQKFSECYRKCANPLDIVEGTGIYATIFAEFCKPPGSIFNCHVEFDLAPDWDFEIQSGSISKNLVNPPGFSEAYYYNLSSIHCVTN
jgi:hypothetical protein